MKKAIAVFLALILFCSSGLAVSIDVSTLNDEELLDLFATVETEVNTRIGECKVLYSGEYVVGGMGDYIEPGDYNLIAVNSAGGAVPFMIAKSQEDWSNNNLWKFETLLIGDIVHYQFEEGNYFSIPYGELALVKCK